MKRDSRIAAVVLTALLPVMASDLRAQGSEACKSLVAPGKSWFGETGGLPNGGSANVLLLFDSDQSFQYKVAFGARNVLAVSGQFSIERSNERAPRWPSACRIVFQPSQVSIRPQPKDLMALQERGLFDGSKQTYRIDKSYGTGETRLLLNAAIDDPTSTSDMYLQKK
jgi:hypothetical protein